MHSEEYTFEFGDEGEHETCWTLEKQEAKEQKQNSSLQEEEEET